MKKWLLCWSLIIFVFVILFVVMISSNKINNKNKKIDISTFFGESKYLKDDIEIKEKKDYFSWNLLEEKILNQCVKEYSRKLDLKVKDLKILYIYCIESNSSYNFLAIIKVPEGHYKFIGQTRIYFKIKWVKLEFSKNYWNKFLYINNN